MAQAEPPPSETAPAGDNPKGGKFWRRLFGKDAGSAAPLTGSPEPTSDPEPEQSDSTQAQGLVRRMSRKVVPGLPRAQTFKRQQSEIRDRLEPVQPTQAERRAVSVDRRSHPLRGASSNPDLPRASAPDFLDKGHASLAPPVASLPSSAPQSPTEEKRLILGSSHGISLNIKDHLTNPSLSHLDITSQVDTQSVTTSHYDAQIHDELERVWILNLSMHFRDRSKREKFFVTYKQGEHLWRRVTVSLDYRNAPENSLELDLSHTQYQRDKSSKIYEAIRESLPDIQFYDTVTNLKLQTTDGRLHVHVVEDVNEIIQYPSSHMIHHLRCRRIRERDLEFDCHMSGFVYRVKVDGRTLIKKEIPGPDTVDEFLYEVNALNNLRFSHNVIEFYGAVVSDDDKQVKGLLISYAEQGALIDVFFEHNQGLSWSTRERWARQIVQGLSDIHEAGFVHGDFTLSNIVIDDDGDAKIIDINRRGCPVGWEPPEATPLIEGNQRISMYIGVKSDLYQLGMVLWALATQDDEPEGHGRPLYLPNEVEVPPWYRKMVHICLSPEPRFRLQAQSLLLMFPEPAQGDGNGDSQDPPSICVDDGHSLQEYLVDEHQGSGPRIRTVNPPTNWPYSGPQQVSSPGFSDYYPSRGRSPPSPMPSHHEPCNPPYIGHDVTWSNKPVASSETDVSHGEPDRDTGATQTGTDEPVTPVENPESQPKDFGDRFDNYVHAGAENVLDKAMSIGATEPHDSGPVGCAEVAEEAQPAADKKVISDHTEEEPKSIPELESQPSTSLKGSGIRVANDTEDPNLQERSEPLPATAEAEADVSADSGGPGKTGPDADPEGSRENQAEEKVLEAVELNSASPAKLAEGQADPGSQSLPEEVLESEVARTTAATGLPMSPQLRTPPSTPRREVPNDLKGVGAAYDAQSEIRQTSCSDEDLGLTTTITTDVTA